MRKKLCLLFVLLLALTSCAPLSQSPGSLPGPELSLLEYMEAKSAQDLFPSPMPLPLASPGGPLELSSVAYTPANSLTVEETVSAYFEELYKGYINLSYVDISSILDMEQDANKNMLRWTRLLNQRRRLIYQNQLCYVERTKFPYKISYIKASALTDGRLAQWAKTDGLAGDDETEVHFVITGNSGEAYPPIMAVNTQHTMRLKKIDGIWKVTFHYFPGSERKFGKTASIKVPDEETMLAQLRKEFADVAAPKTLEIPKGAVSYQPDEAARYARTYCEKRNKSFYRISDWMGNCANFTSQSVWYGFGKKRTKTWFGTSSGGSPAWENVNHFWTYATGKDTELTCQVLQGVSVMRSGDILQTRTGSSKNYTHSLVMVNGQTLKFAQNSPGCFVYYSDLVNLETRILRPVYLAVS